MILAFLLLIVVIVFTFDYYRIFLNWFGRIKIGQWENESQWRQKIKEAADKWAKNGVPFVPEHENERNVLYKKLKNAGKKSTIAYWQEAALLKTASLNSDGAGAQSLVERYIEPFSGQWISPPERPDAAMLSYEILCCRFIDKNDVKPAMDFMAKLLLDSYNENGFIPYNPTVPDMAFVDTVGMICPFLIKYACTYDRPAFADIAMKQILTYRRFGFDDTLGLPYHCVNMKTKVHSGISDWGRGSAWWLLGLTDSFISIIDMDGFNKQKVTLLKLCLETVERFGKYVNEDGFVNRMLTVQSLPDSTATAMYAYCFSALYGILKDESLIVKKQKMLDALETATRRNGVIDYSQGDTPGIGYYASGFSVMPAAQGFACAAVFSEKDN